MTTANQHACCPTCATERAFSLPGRKAFVTLMCDQATCCFCHRHTSAGFLFRRRDSQTPCRGLTGRQHGGDPAVLLTNN
jgi:hypothetical protein